MSSDYRNLSNQDAFVCAKMGKKNLRRGKKLESDPEFPDVFENDGFEEETDEAKTTVDENCGDWQVRSKENRILDWSNPTRNRLDNLGQAKNTTPESVELKEKDINVRQCRSGKETPQARPSSEPLKKTNTGSQSSAKKDFLARLSSAKPNFNRLRHSRPSLTADMVQSGYKPAEEDPAKLPFGRSQSVRGTSTTATSGQKPRRKLLRDLSLSDSDDTSSKDYGSLGKVPLPRRLSESDLPTQSSIRILITTMQELINRGKVYRLIVIDVESCKVLATIPEIKVSPSDAHGMVKSLILTSPTIFKLQVCGELYSCFQHSQKSVQGRSDDVVMVMQKTCTCLVVAFSREETPGSCQSEVMEFAKVLERVDW